MVIETDARKPLMTAINIENSLFTIEIKVMIIYIGKIKLVIIT